MKEHSGAVEAVKETLSSVDTLTHYDPKLPLTLACDPSPIGVGAVLSHTFPGGKEEPIAYALRKLTKSEKNYAQIQKEALGIVFGVKKFRQYSLRRKFKLHTDHKPLLSIFHPQKGIPLQAGYSDGPSHFQLMIMKSSIYHIYNMGTLMLC